LTPDRWQQISRIFKSAISLDGADRDAYLKGVDESLREEVEKLLDSHQKASDEQFIDGIAAEANAELLVDEDELSPEQTRRLNKGQQLGSYVILDALGSGGMGEVYLANDTRLDRTVALKVLSQDIASDHRRMQRFRQEAKIASSLNQPNILTIFEFGEVEGLTFLATEFIDGVTLRSHLHRKRLKVGEILDIAIQVLAALDAAHEAHIIHRDIKPENVMIRRRDNVVKVLDFGLAKAAAERKSSTFTAQESEAATEFKTAPHVLMGTINYMSPEQAQAHPVDVRTDIWSTGVMIYEMVSGLMPFKGATVSHTVVQILEKEPVPLTQFTQRKAPEELQRIVAKALAKSPDERYQTAKDMLIDLRSLKKKLDVEAEIHRTSSQETPRATVVSEEVGRGPQQRRVLGLALIAMAVATVGIFGFSIWRASRVRTGEPVATPPPAPVAVEERTLTYSITVQKYRNNKPFQEQFTISGEMIFEADYRIRLNIRSPQSGYLYVLNEGPREASAAPEFVLLFPSSTANNGSPFLNAGQVVTMPEKSWIWFDTEKGIEKLWLVFASEAVPELEAVKEFAGTRTVGLINDPAKISAIQNFIAAHSGSKPSAEKGDKETTVKGTGKVLLHPIKLDHY
jgi:serine/threonine protein kinase